MRNFDFNTSSLSQGILRIHHHNDALTIFFSNNPVFAGLAKIAIDYADACLADFKYGVNDEVNHSLWHKNSPHGILEHSHLLTDKLITYDEFKCLLDLIVEEDDNAKLQIRLQKGLAALEEGVFYCVKGACGYINRTTELLTKNDYKRLLKTFEEAFYPSTSKALPISVIIACSTFLYFLIRRRNLVMRSESHKVNNGDKNKKKKTDFHLCNTPPETVSIRTTTMQVCNADQCSVGFEPAPSSAISNTLPDRVVAIPTKQPEIQVLLYPNSTVLEEVCQPRQQEATSENMLQIPDSLQQAIFNAAKNGMLSAFLLTLTEDVLSAYCHPDNIYWVNQAVRALLLISMGTGYIATAALPVSNWLLIKFAGMRRENATLLSTSALLATILATSQAGLATTTITMAAGIGSSVLAGLTTRKATGWIKQALFGRNERAVIIKSNDISLTNQRLTLG